MGCLENVNTSWLTVPILKRVLTKLNARTEQMKGRKAELIATVFELAHLGPSAVPSDSATTGAAAARAAVGITRNQLRKTLVAQLPDDVPAAAIDSWIQEPYNVEDQAEDNEPHPIHVALPPYASPGQCMSVKTDRGTFTFVVPPGSKAGDTVVITPEGSPQAVSDRGGGL